MAEILSKVKNIHLVGIGGVGMSGLALLLKDKGFFVSGSDMQDSYQLQLLKEEGIRVFIGHDKTQVAEEVQMLGYSSAVEQDNPEIEEAKKRGIQILKRGQLLAELCRDVKTIAVAGSHGKTTTTALFGYVLTSLGYEPTVFLGGLPLNYSRGAWWGKDYCVVETDESDGSFLYHDPWVSVITNVDHEHLDHYKSMEEINRNFLAFARKTQNKVLGWGGQPAVAKIIDTVGGIKFGWEDFNQVQGRNFNFDGKYSCFNLFIKRDFITSVKLPLIGEHNCRNSLAVFAYLWYLNGDLKKAAEILENFRGTKRRFQLRETVAGVTFVDDYAHHPTEIEAVIKAARLLEPRRLFIIFQPHRYSRVKLLFERFLSCFSQADRVVVTDIYGAHEMPLEGINSEALAKQMTKFSLVRASYIPRDELSGSLRCEFKAGDLVLALGAGDINALMGEVIDEFKNKRTHQ